MRIKAELLRTPDGLRFCHLGQDGHVQSRVDLVCANDEAAKEQAKQLADGYDIELWQLDHRIAEFKATHPGRLWRSFSR